MNILIVSQYYYPEQFQINEIAPELVRRGHKVTVLTGLPNYPKGEIYEGYEKGRRNEKIDGVRVIRVNEHPRKKGAVNLFRNYISFAVQGRMRAKRLKNFDIVLCYQLSPVSTLEPAILYAKKNHVPLVAYCLDIWPESAKAHTSIKPLYQAIAVYSKMLYKKCDHIAVTSRPFIDYLSEVNGIDKRKMSYIPQHADDSMLKKDIGTEDNGIVDFMYAGNMGQGQRLDVIIKAAAKIRSRDFLVHMVGDGSQREELEKLSKKLGVQDKVIFHGNQQREDMPSWYRKADVLLITLRGNNAVGNTMPGKLQAYMTTGKPVLGAINGAAAEVINAAKCGRCVAAGDHKGLSELMMDYIDNSDKYKECGNNAKIYFKKHFTLEKYCDSLENVLKEMV
ncbi:glycosyltransferase family 4 protein [uncultured Ruminococcus sp.]|uniref:glycosyltransferase family 4 protein n=1 Tax=uncultured Ruminococcus sp. TaxID=165186 RepID=UPI0025E01E4D|nr:glycosyltransferase family 4 protein [uncultured Ruminococcus sp.]